MKISPINNFPIFGQNEPKKIIFALQIAVWGSICADIIGLRIPLVRELICFIYLTFVPGYILLKFLRKDDLDRTICIIYTVSLSLAFLMFVGFSLNMLFFFLDFSRPISLFPLVLIISTLVLLGLSLNRGWDKPSTCSINKKVKNRQVLLLAYLILLPLISICGTYIKNVYNTNLLLLILLLAISIIPFLVYFDILKEDLFAVSIFFISLALLFHRSLISNQLWGSDIFEEFYYSNLVLKNYYWDFSIPSDLNSILSIVILPDIYSILCNVSLVFVFKIFYPFFYSFVPLALFSIYKKQVNSRISLYGCLFFMYANEFFGTNSVLMRQEIGELFLVSLISLMIFESSNPILFLIFGASLIISHYTLSYLFFAIILVSIVVRRLILALFENTHDKNKLLSLYFNFNKSIILLIFSITWSIYVSSSNLFNGLIDISRRIVDNFVSDFLTPGSTEGLRIMLMSSPDLFNIILKYLYILSQLFIVLGLAKIIFIHFYSDLSMNNGSNAKKSFLEEYLFFSVISLSLLLASVLVPYFSGNIGTIRLFHITLIFLSPFAPVGAIFCLTILFTAFKMPGIKNFRCISHLSIASFLSLFLLLNAGFFQEISGYANPISLSLSSNSKYLEQVSIFDEEELYGAKYMSNILDGADVYADIISRQLLRAYIYPKSKIKNLREGNSIQKNNRYIYFRKMNMRDDFLIIPDHPQSIERPYLLATIADIGVNKSILNKLYSNGGSEIWN